MRNFLVLIGVLQLASCSSGGNSGSGALGVGGDQSITTKVEGSGGASSVGGTTTASSGDRSTGGIRSIGENGGSGGASSSGGNNTGVSGGIGGGGASSSGSTSNNGGNASGGTTPTGGTKPFGGTTNTSGTAAGGTTVTTVTAGGATNGVAGTPQVGGSSSGSAGANPGTEEWVPSWATSIQRTEQSNLPPPLAGNTLRQFVWPTLSGSKIRIQLSNERGNGPVELKTVHIAMAAGADASTTNGKIDKATDKEFHFQGAAAATIARGETIWSDSLDFDLQELKLTSITMQFGTQVPSDITGHPGARTTSYVANGDAVSQETLAGAQTRERWYFINAIEIMAPTDVVAIAAFGDSITDGYGVKNAFNRWPDYLTLAIKRDVTLAKKRTVLNFGMGANNLTVSGTDQDSGLVRFDRDVMRRDKIRYVVFLQGVNDILYSNVQKQPIVEGYKQIMSQAKSKGIKVVGSPILPLDKDATKVDAAKETIRKSVNESVLKDNIFDQVIDFAKLLADPSNESIFLAKYAGDAPHPNITGYEAMGNAVDVAWFK